MKTMPTTLAYALEKLKVQFPGYDFAVTAKESINDLDPIQIIKAIVAELKVDYEDVVISLPRETYGAIAIIRVKSKPGTYDLAWYQNDSIGYVGDDIYRDIKNDIENNEDFKNLGMRVDSYIEGNRHLEYYIYY